MYRGKYGKVLGLFFENPTSKFHIREIGRLAGVHPNSVLSAVDFLKKEGLLKIEKKRHVVDVSANMENEEFIFKKRIYNLEKIYDSGIIEVIEKRFEPNSISLIGSFSKGEDIEKSDIDLVIISKKNAGNLSLEKFENILRRKIHLIAADYDKISDEFYTNLINGILLYGYLRKK